MTWVSSHGTCRSGSYDCLSSTWPAEEADTWKCYQINDAPFFLQRRSIPQLQKLHNKFYWILITQRRSNFKSADGSLGNRNKNDVDSSFEFHAVLGKWCSNEIVFTCVHLIQSRFGKYWVLYYRWSRSLWLVNCGITFDMARFKAIWFPLNSPNVKLQGFDWIEGFYLLGTPCLSSYF